MAERVYVVETEYVGPNQHNLSTDHDRIVNGHFYDIQREPGRANMSGEPKIEGWLGTTDDWCMDARGEFDSAEAAESWIKEQYSVLREGELDLFETEEEGVVARFYVGPDNIWDTGDWLGDTVTREPGRTIIEGPFDNDGIENDIVITPETTDEELERFEAAIVSIAESEGVTLWEPFKELVAMRDDVEPAEDDEDDCGGGSWDRDPNCECRACQQMRSE